MQKRSRYCQVTTTPTMHSAVLHQGSWRNLLVKNFGSKQSWKTNEVSTPQQGVGVTADDVALLIVSVCVRVARVDV